jgi:hypothetical protein
MKTEILKRIILEQSMLGEEDIEGHIWWNKFEEFVRAIPEEQYQAVNWQLCPKCAGEGKVQNLGTSTSTHSECNLCYGAKVVTPKLVKVVNE